MPSTTSSWVSRLLASSTVMTPSFPTFSIASAIKSPIARSPLADTMPTWAISALLLVDLESFFSSSTTAVTARSTPRLRLIGSWPAATSLAPSVKRARASTVAVVVPSPATSEVLEAISFATVTPSLVTVGAPHDFSSTTLRPRGPSVTVTASARMLTPRSTLARASALNSTNFPAIARSSYPSPSTTPRMSSSRRIRGSSPSSLISVPAYLAEQYPVTGLHVERQDLAVLRLTGTDRTGERVGSRFITRSSVLSQDAVGFETARGRLPLPLAEFGPEASAVVDHTTRLSIPCCRSLLGFRAPFYVPPPPPRPGADPCPTQIIPHPHESLPRGVCIHRRPSVPRQFSRSAARTQVVAIRSHSKRTRGEHARWPIG